MFRDTLCPPSPSTVRDPKVVRPAPVSDRAPGRFGARGRCATYVLIGLLSLGLRAVLGEGFLASDDLGYTEFARRLAAGDWTPQPHHYWSRYGVTLPVALLFSVFGIREWVLSLLPLVASSLCVLLTMRIGERLGGLRVGCMAGLLYATFPLHLRYGTSLLPEPIANAWILGALLLYLREGWSIRRDLLTGFCLGCATLTKEPALFVAAGIVGHGLVIGRFRSAWTIGAAVAGVGVIELAFHGVMTGDPLFRLHAMQVHEASGMAIGANRDLGYRLTRAYPVLMLGPSLALGLHSMVSVGLGWLGWNALARSERWLTALWCALPALYLNFGSSSLGHYLALPVAPRYLEFTYPPLFLWTAVQLSRWSAAASRPWLLRRAPWGIVATLGGCGVLAAILGLRHGPIQRTLDELRAAVGASQARVVQVVVAAEARSSQVPDRWIRAARLIAPERHLVGGDANLDPEVAVDRILVGADGVVTLVPAAARD